MPRGRDQIVGPRLTKEKPRSQDTCRERGRIVCHPGSEVQLQSKLDFSRVVRRSDCAKVARREGCAHAVEFRVVPQVEEFRPEFQAAAALFTEDEGLEER